MSDLLAKLAKYGVPPDLLCQVNAVIKDAVAYREQKALHAERQRKLRSRAVTCRHVPSHAVTEAQKPNEINGELFSEFAGEKERKEEKGLPHTPSKEKKRKKEDISLISGFEGFWGAYPRPGAWL